MFCLKAATDRGCCTGCAIRNKLKPGGFHCHGGCINGNTGYADLGTAWLKCSQLAACTRIMKWGKYYLRKANDHSFEHGQITHVDFCVAGDFFRPPKGWRHASLRHCLHQIICTNAFLIALHVAGPSSCAGSGAACRRLLQQRSLRRQLQHQLHLFLPRQRQLHLSLPRRPRPLRRDMRFARSQMAHTSLNQGRVCAAQKVKSSTQRRSARPHVAPRLIWGHVQS